VAHMWGCYWNSNTLKSLFSEFFDIDSLSFNEFKQEIPIINISFGGKADMEGVATYGFQITSENPMESDFLIGTSSLI
jgi:hypothetical protein